MSYHGNVTPGGTPDVRELTHLVITKLAVSEMSNNVYLLRCRDTDDQVLIDAADDAGDDPEAGRATTASAPWSPPTSTGTTTGRWPRSSTPPARTPWPGPTTPTRCPSR